MKYNGKKWGEQGQLANGATSSVYMIIICVAFWVLHGWLIISQRFLLAGVETREEMRDFLLFWPKHDGRTDWRTDGQALL